MRNAIIFVVIFNTLILIGCGNKSDNPIQVAEKFYALEEKFPALAIPDRAQIVRFKPLTSESLNLLFNKAFDAQEHCNSVAGNQMPVELEGDLIVGSFESATSIKVLSAKLVSENFEVAAQVNFGENRINSIVGKISKTDHLILKKENDKWVVTDIRWQDNQFLSESLKQYLVMAKNYCNYK